MNAREYPTLTEAFAGCGAGEVVAVWRGVGVPDRYGVLPRFAETGEETLERKQPVGEFLESVGGWVEAEARRLVAVDAEVSG